MSIKPCLAAPRFAEQANCIIAAAQNHLRHAVMEQCRQCLRIGIRQLHTDIQVNAIRDATLDAADMIQAAILRDVGCFRRPGEIVPKRGMTTNSLPSRLQRTGHI